MFLVPKAGVENWLNSINTEQISDVRANRTFTQVSVLPSCPLNKTRNKNDKSGKSGTTYVPLTTTITFPPEYISEYGALDRDSTNRLPKVGVIHGCSPNLSPLVSVVVPP